MAPARLSVGTLHYVEHTVYKAQKALIAAKFNGLVLDTRIFDVQKDSRKPDFKAKNPTGKVPYLETNAGCIFTSNAVARHVARCRADTSLYGSCFDDEGQIDSWIDFCTHEVEVPLMTWVYPVLGLMEDDARARSEAQADVEKALGVMEKQLKANKYLVGSAVTLADITLVCALKEGFCRVFTPDFRKRFAKVSEWFEHCCGLPQFKAVLGDVALCTAAQAPRAVLPAFAPPARQAAAPKAAAKAASAPKGGAKAAAKAEPKAKAAALAPSAASGGDVDAKIKAVGDEIRALKEKLKGEGLSGKKINDHEDVKRLVEQLTQLKAQAVAAPAPSSAPQAAPAASPPAAAGGGDAEAQVKAVGDEIRALKEKLKGEGLSGKKINDHAEVKRLVAQLTELKTKL